MKKSEVQKQLERQHAVEKTPLDTLSYEYPNQHGLQLIVYEYYDSLPDKPIKQFVVKDVKTQKLVFRSCSEGLFLKDEVDPIKGQFDSLMIIPQYSIISNSPLVVSLDLNVFGGPLGFMELKELTYDFYEHRDASDNYTLRFVKYSFSYSNPQGWQVDTQITFNPPACEIEEAQLIDRFNKAKDIDLVNTIGNDIEKNSFVCYLNGKNASYQEIRKAFDASFESFADGSPYNYHTYIDYLHLFLFNDVESLEKR